MATYSFTHDSQNLVIGLSSLILAGDELTSRNLVLARVNSQGSISVRNYNLLSNRLLLASVPSIGRFSNQTFTHNSTNLVFAKTVHNGTITSSKFFPEIVPTAVQFKPSKYVVTEHPAQSGEVETHLWADSKAGASLQLDYINIADATAERILALWDAVSGTYGSLSIPVAVLAGVEQELKGYMLTGGSNTKWFFAEVPKWQGRIKGYGDMKVSLVSRIVSFTAAVGGNVPFAFLQVEDISPTSFENCDYIIRGPDEPDTPTDPCAPTGPVFTLPANPNTVTPDTSVRVLGFHFTTLIDRVLKKVGVYAQTTTDHSIGLWEFSPDLITRLLLWQKQIPLSDPYILEQGFRWYDVPDLTLTAGKDYVIATTWSSDPIVCQLNSVVGLPTVNISSFSLDASARIASGDPRPSSHLTDLNAYPPTGTSGFDDKGYYTVNMQLSDCVP
jgi:hypothetical protein